MLSSVIWKMDFRHLISGSTCILSLVGHLCSLKKRLDSFVEKPLNLFELLFFVAGESQSCHKGQCGRRRVVSCRQGAEHQIQDCQVNLYKPVFLYNLLFACEFWISKDFIWKFSDSRMGSKSACKWICSWMYWEKLNVFGVQ